MSRPTKYYVCWEEGRATKVVAGYAAAYKVGSFRGFHTHAEAVRYATEWNERAAMERPLMFIGHAPIEFNAPPEPSGAQLAFAF